MSETLFLNHSTWNDMKWTFPVIDLLKEKKNHFAVEKKEKKNRWMDDKFNVKYNLIPI